MKKSVLISLIIFISTIMNIYAKDNTITILYDNYSYKEGLKTGWGFSCLINYHNNMVLFDTGADFPTLYYNIKQLKINPDSIKIIVISHMHHDHTGGLEDLLPLTDNVTLFLPSDASTEDINRYSALGANVKLVKDKMEIIDDIYSTGPLGSFIKEQSLVIVTQKGAIIITGCAHPGIDNIVKFVKESFRKEILLVLGGFHLFSSNKNKIEKIIKRFNQLGVMYAAPSHCSGDTAKRMFKNSFKNHYIDVGTGYSIDIDRLK